MKLWITSVFVDDQDKALKFYTEVLGFVKKNDVPMGEHKWLTVVSPGDPDGVELLLEPAAHPAVGPYRRALVDSPRNLLKCQDSRLRCLTIPVGISFRSLA